MVSELGEIAIMRLSGHLAALEAVDRLTFGSQAWADAAVARVEAAAEDVGRAVAYRGDLTPLGYDPDDLRASVSAIAAEVHRITAIALQIEADAGPGV